MDSIELQTLKLLDKPGLRKKGSIPPDPDKQIKHLDDNDVKNVLAAFGIGTGATDEEKADRIRNELNN